MTAPRPMMVYPSMPMYFDEFKPQLPDIDPAETAEWLESLDEVVEAEGVEPGALPHVQAAQARAAAERRPARAHPDRATSTPSPRAGAAVPRRRGASSAASAGIIRWNAVAMVAPRQQPLRRHRRPPLHVRVGRRRLYEVGFNHFFRGKDDGRHGRPGLLPGPRRAGHLRARVPRGPPHRGPARPLPARGRAGPGPLLLPAPAADARLLGVPDRLDGPRAAGNAVYQARFNRYLHNRGISRHQPNRACGRSSATARWTSPRRSPALSLAGARGARQPDLRRQLQPAATRRAGARQRQDHPGARGRSSAAPAGT